MTDRAQPLVGGLGALIMTAGATAATGIAGLLAGVLFTVLWYVLPATYAVAFGQIIVAALLAPTSAPLVVLLCEGGLLAVLVSPTLALDQVRFRVLLTVGCAVVFAGGVWLLVRWQGSIWLPALILASSIAVGIYGLHRYDRVLRGVVEVGEPYE